MNRSPNGAILRNPKLPTGNVLQTTETCATGVIQMPTENLTEDGQPCIHNASFTKFQRLTNSQENLKSVNGAVIPLNMNSRVLENTRMIQCFA